MEKFKTLRTTYKGEIMIFANNTSYIIRNDKWVAEDLKQYSLDKFDDYNITSRVKGNTDLLYVTLDKGEAQSLTKKEFLLFVREDIYQDIILKHKIKPTIRIMQELIKLTNDIYERGANKWEEDGNIAMQILSFLRLLDNDTNRYLEEFYDIIEGDFIE